MDELNSDGWLDLAEDGAEAAPRGLIPARLVYDSSRDTHTSGGVRSAEAPSQVLYEAENYSLDLCLSRERSKARMVLVGQIADRSEPTRKLASLPVSLESDGDSAERSESNPLGEFYFEYDANQRVRLRIPIADRSIEVPLPRLAKQEELTFTPLGA